MVRHPDTSSGQWLRYWVVLGEWATVGLLRDNIFELLCLKSTAPDYNVVVL